MEIKQGKHVFFFFLIILNTKTHMLFYQLGLKTVKLAGSMTAKRRTTVLAAFKEDPSVHAILMSLKAGGEGLNLQEASHVFLLDPWWNPAIEQQATDRAHRIGQKEPVTVYRFVAQNTIEGKIRDMHKRKKHIAHQILDISENTLSFESLVSILQDN